MNIFVMNEDGTNLAFGFWFLVFDSCLLILFRFV